MLSVDRDLDVFRNGKCSNGSNVLERALESYKKCSS